MSNDPRVISREIIEKVKALKFFNGSSTPPDMPQRIDDLVRTVTQEACRKYKASPDADQGRINDEVTQAHSVQNMIGELKSNTSRLKQGYEIAKDERAQLGKIENAQGFRRVIWRAASTASVASVILFAWWFAHKNGIPLPLMRVPVPTP